MEKKNIIVKNITMCGLNFVNGKMVLGGTMIEHEDGIDEFKQAQVVREGNNIMISAVGIDGKEKEREEQKEKEKEEQDLEKLRFTIRLYTYQKYSMKMHKREMKRLNKEMERIKEDKKEISKEIEMQRDLMEEQTIKKRKRENEQGGEEEEAMLINNERRKQLLEYMQNLEKYEQVDENYEKDKEAIKQREEQREREREEKERKECEEHEEHEANMIEYEKNRKDTGQKGCTLIPFVSPLQKEK